MSFIELNRIIYKYAASSSYLIFFGCIIPQYTVCVKGGITIYSGLYEN